MSEDKVQSFEIYSPKFNFDLKGHTKIELRNPYRTQVFEDDNVVQTDILNHQLDELGDYNMSVYKNTWSPLWKYLFGGIFLFDNTIPVGSKYMPQGVTMTGNGSAGTNNTAAPLAMGSWDSMKSSIDATQCKMVYNWSQQQGNGDIASVCLTSRVGGYIGYGNKDNVQKSVINITTDQNHNIIYAPSDFFPSNMYMDENYMTFVSFNNTEKTATIKKVNRSVYNLNLINRIADPEIVTLNYTTELDGTMSNTWISDGGKKIVYSGNKTVNIGSTIRVLVIDMETETLTEYTVTNNSDSNWVYTSGSSNISIKGFDGTHIFIGANSHSSNTKIYKVRLSDSQVIDTIEGVYADDERAGVIPLTDNHDCMADSSHRACIIDNINNTKYPINGNPFWIYKDYEGSSFLGYNKTLDIIQTTCSQNTYGAIRWKVFKNPLYLATINNLDSVVTKTNEDSMIVTYTLEQTS